MTEKQLLDVVVETAHIFNWLVAHFRASRTKHGWTTAVGADGKGFPDLCMVRPGDRILFAELKVGYNKLSADQEMWRDTIINAGGEWHQWTEKEWESGLIESVLR